jgi:CheY-like chemotaxis protein/predicted regulator of Ras-like GTPase activity (Roadblock/LC7/MglB family)
MAAKILVVDRNEAFATMLQDMLETDGGYEVEITHVGSAALDHLRRNDYELTIVDTDLDPADMTCAALIQAIRQLQPTMRLMLIPLMGEELPEETRRFDIQGTLSKPFFADDLLPNIQDALARQVEPVAPPPPSPPPAHPEIPAAPVAKPGSDIQAVLADLARETRADAVVLLSSSQGQAGVLAHVGSMSGERIETLADLSMDTVQAAGSAADFLGQPDGLFEHNMFESKTLRLYIMALPENLSLVIVTPASTPLGTIRYNMRRARRELARRTLT